MSFKLKRDPTEKKDILIKYKGSDAEVVIPNGVYKIGIGAFRANCNIRRVVIPRGVKFIEEQAFRRCKSLETVELPQGLIKVGFLAFQYCEKLENIRLPGSIQTIEASAFETCYALKQIKLPDNLSAIESAALGKTGLVKCVIPGRIRVIRSFLMHDCPELTCVTIMDGVEIIEGSAFQDCPKLADIEIPLSVIEIHEEAFNSEFSKKLNTTVRIHGAPGSAAEIFAKAHGLPFVDAPVSAEKTLEEKRTLIAGVSDGNAKTKPAPLPAAARPETLPAAANRFEQCVAELKERYAGKPVPATLQQFRAENRDMDFAAFSAWVREARGSTPAKYLTEQGLMARAQAVPPPETGKKAALAQSDPDFAAPRDPALAAPSDVGAFKYDNKVSFYLPPGFTYEKRKDDFLKSDSYNFPIKIMHVPGEIVKNSDNEHPAVFAPGFILDILTKQTLCDKYMIIPGSPPTMFSSAVIKLGHLIENFLTPLNLMLYVETGGLYIFHASMLAFFEDDDPLQKYKIMLECAKALRVNGEPLPLEGIDEKALKGALEFTAKEARRKKIILWSE